MMVDVDLKRDGHITQMDESLLRKEEGVDERYDDDGVLHDVTVWTKYWLEGVAHPVHESAHTTVKRMVPAMKPILAKLLG